MGFSRREVNIKRLLTKCEFMAKDSTDDWRLEKFIETLEEMVADLKASSEKPSDDVILSYLQRIECLKGFVTVHQIESPLEKMVAAQLAPKGYHDDSREIHRKTQERINIQLRHELLTKQGDGLRRRRSTGIEGGSEQSDVEDDMDTLLKYHHHVQEKIADNMLVLAQSIKEQSLLAGKIIRSDTKNVETSGELADRNFNQLHIESEKLQEENRRAWRFWIWILIVIVLIIFTKSSGRIEYLDLENCNNAFHNWRFC